ncbi:glycosyl transferase [Fodinicola acaciae]|uniref:glycosyl transferase n=1 Tax=Fodinicola acaciae TaxID=2681555 RepID=UPI001C9E60CE|nr:glycosyl transferase [Fodinicola acaciae]
MTIAADRVTEPPQPTAIPRTPRWPVDVAVVGAYVLLSCYLYAGLLAGVGPRYLVDSNQDQTQWEWFFSATAYALAHGENPLISALQNHPLGVNMMANTAMLGLSVPLTPVTLAFGPAVTWTVVLVGGVAATAACWYALMAGQLRIPRGAAAIGAAFAGFAPPIVSHANAHPNLAVLFVLPLIVGRFLRLRERPVVRTGVTLGLLAAYQVFLGEEALLLCATGLGLFTVAYAVMRPREALAAARPVLSGIGVAVAVFVPLVALPLGWQFFGPQSYRSLLHGNAGNDLAALLAFPARSLAGDPTALQLSFGPTEQNSFFGWPLAILLVVAAVATWRMVAARALAITILAATVLSLGSWLVAAGHTTRIPGPWLLFSHLPLYESVLESRLTMICVPAIGILLALAISRLRTERRRHIRLAWSAGLAAALLPIFPTPLAAADRPPTPAFFSQGIWRDYVPARSRLPVIVPVPVPEPADATALHWQVEAGMGFALPDGYFVGPWGPRRQGAYGAEPRATADLLRRVRDTGQPQAIGADERDAARTDFAYWQADIVVLPPGPREEPLRRTLDDLLGPGRQAGGVRVWPARVR